MVLIDSLGGDGGEVVVVCGSVVCVREEDVVCSVVVSPCVVVVVVVCGVVVCVREEDVVCDGGDCVGVVVVAIPVSSTVWRAVFFNVVIFNPGRLCTDDFGDVRKGNGGASGVIVVAVVHCVVLFVVSGE